MSQGLFFRIGVLCGHVFFARAHTFAMVNEYVHEACAALLELHMVLFFGVDHP